MFNIKCFLLGHDWTPWKNYNLVEDEDVGIYQEMQEMMQTSLPRKYRTCKRCPKVEDVIRISMKYND